MLTLELTNLKIRDLLNAHNQLDGYQDVVTDKMGQQISVPKSYILPVSTIVDITKNIKILREHVVAANEQRDDLLKRLSDGTNEIDGEKEPEKARNFSKGVSLIEEDRIEVKGLLMLKMENLLNSSLQDEMEAPKKDKDKKTPNRVPPTVLASLSPILDIFQSDTE